MDKRNVASHFNPPFLVIFPVCEWLKSLLGRIDGLSDHRYKACARLYASLCVMSVGLGSC